MMRNDPFWILSSPAPSNTRDAGITRNQADNRQGQETFFQNEKNCCKDRGLASAPYGMGAVRHSPTFFALDSAVWTASKPASPLIDQHHRKRDFSVPASNSSLGCVREIDKGVAEDRKGAKSFLRSLMATLFPTIRSVKYSIEIFREFCRV